MNEEHQIDKRRVLLVDDHPLLREGLAHLIKQQDDLEVCGEAGTIGAADAEVNRLRPDVLVLDLRLGSQDSIEFIKSLRARLEGLRILVLAQFEESLFAERSIRAGADGYVTKLESSEEVLLAVRTVLGGELYVSRKVAAQLFLRAARPAPAAQTITASLAGLSDRELHVFQLLGTGLGTRQVAGQLGLSHKTVETHREHIKTKLGLDGAKALLRCSREWVESLGLAGANDEWDKPPLKAALGGIEANVRTSAPATAPGVFGGTHPSHALNTKTGK